MPALDKLLEPGKVLAGALSVPPPMVWVPWTLLGCEAQAVVLSIPSQRPVSALQLGMLEM